MAQPAFPGSCSTQIPARAAVRPPWAIRAKLLRKLQTAEFRQHVVDADADASVLVIGEPKCDSQYPRLAGARDEAQCGGRALKGRALGAQQVKALISPDDPEQFGADALTVINALMERDWRIVHIAGHGEPPEMMGPVPKKRGDPAQQLVNPRGVVLSGDAFLGPREIRNMRAVPELVFVNCCHLGRTKSERGAQLHLRSVALRRERGRRTYQDRRALRGRCGMGGGGRSREDFRNNLLRGIAWRPPLHRRRG